ncbi:hypothetical protein ACFL0Z_02720 [Patescibacteria group bacterium]
MKKMETFSDCQELLAPAAADLFAVGNTVYHGLGMWELVPAATIVCLDDDDLQRRVQADGGQVFSLEERLQKQNVIFRNTAKLLAQEEVISFLKSRSDHPQLYISKPIKRLEIMAGKFGWELLGASSKLNKLFEDKVSFVKIMSAVGGDEIPREVCLIRKSRLESLGKKYGWPLAVQFSHGLAGAGTFFVEPDTLAEFVSQHEGKEGVVAPKLAGRGKTITLNACVLPQGVILGAPFLQISGVSYLNKNEGGTCGNDYGVNLEIDQQQRRQVFEETMRIGELMRKQGYRGLFGIDYVVGDKVWLIEVNARPPASVPTYTQGEHDRNEVSLLGLHLLDSLGIPFDIDIDKLNDQKFHALLKGSKLIFRNLTSEAVTFSQDFSAGVYEIGGQEEFEFNRPATSLTALQDDKEALFWSVKSGKQVNSNIELATLILPRPATATDGNLSVKVSELVAKLSKKLSSHAT